jgi:cell division protein FtsI/penicillin-binding protein 2
MRSHRRTAAAAVICVTLPLLTVACSSAPPDAQTVANNYLSDWAEQDWQSMQALANAPPSDFISYNSGVFKELGIRQATFTESTLTATATSASEPVVERLEITPTENIILTTILHLSLEQGHWLVDWTPATIIPQLQPGDHLKLSTVWPRREPILADNGTPLATRGQVVTIGIEGARIHDTATVSSALITAGATTDEVTTALAAAKANPTDFEPVFTVTMAEYQRLKPTIYPIPGTVFQTSTQWQAITPGLANGLVGTMGPITAQELKQLGTLYGPQNAVGQTGLEAAEERTLAGTPGLAITVVNSAGATVAPIATFPAVSGSVVQTTIDPATQEAAESALAGETQAASLVAVNTSTGAVLAAANVNTGDFDVAIDGTAPPGSTFKILTSTALIEHGLSPASAASCPTTITEDGEVFHNAEGDSPVDSMLQAFTESCNTAFIGLASNDLTPADFTTTAAQYDIGKTMNLGLTAFPGSVPTPINGADLAATAIGQGRVVVNPLDMAMVAADVATGTVREPVLVTGVSASTPVTHKLPAAVVSALHTMMASVVTSGTAAGQGLPAGTYAKTGTAEYGTTPPLKLDAWLVGFHGDIAFACLVLDSPGNGGPTCGPIVAKFLNALSGS